ncbi:MAG TPA: response regulator [Gemmatimonadaceae bacterium]|jgi:CheY-like chemotaxis protein
MTAPLTILLADDEPDTRTFLARTFEHFGYRTLEAGTGADALDLARSTSVDAIVMDIGMPVMDGIVATRMLKRDKRTASIPIIALSGSMADKQRHDAMAAGCANYLIKPVSPRTIVAEVLHWLKVHEPASP